MPVAHTMPCLSVQGALSGTRVADSGALCVVQVHVGGLMGSVPPVAVEMVAIMTGLVERCALVGLQRRPPAQEGELPVLVVLSIAPLCLEVRAGVAEALRRSCWAKLTSQLHVVAYSGRWPVDQKHSSKCDRRWLREWVAGQRESLVRLQED